MYFYGSKSTTSCYFLTFTKKAHFYNLITFLYFKQALQFYYLMFASTYSFCSIDLNSFILLLRKGVYPFEYMNNWEIFDETSLLDKESFYSSLNMENIDDIDYRHGNKLFKNLS